MAQLSEFEINKITEIVAGKVGANLDAKALRQVIDTVVDKLNAERGNPEITGVTCEVSRNAPTAPSSPFTPKRPDEKLAEDAGGLYDQIDKTDATRVILAVFGKNRPGVVAAITAVLAELSCNIEDMSQKILQDFFSMIMIVDTKECTIDFASLRDRLKATESQLGMKVYLMHEDIFEYMHRI
jgi:ACT domain-containing protein